jgi:outer membrane protein assembly factor BamB
MKLLPVTIAVLVLCASTLGAYAQSQDSSQSGASWWNNWRGPLGTGAATAGNPPTEWGEKKNVRWKVAIRGLGSSSPIIWKDRVYLTTAIKTETEGEPTAKPAKPREGRRGGRRGSRGGWRNSKPPTKIHEFVVLCLDRKDGKLVWSTNALEAVPHEAGHSTATQASNSPITDGEFIYAFFGSRGIHCLDMQGKLKWSKQFGKRTGKELWRTPRDERTTWGTPIVAKVGDRHQVIITGTKASRGYDLETGKVVWSCGGMTRNCIPSPIHKDGVVYLMSGFRGNSLQAIKLAGAKGDITGSKNVLWSLGRGTSYVPSALLEGGLLYFLRTNSAVLTCVDAKTGEVCFEGQRIEGMRTIYSSPFSANGRIYLTSRKGMTKVIEAGAEYKELATNQLDGDRFDSTIAIAGDELYLRSGEHLYCIARK